jgi:ankyrin repeat protein
MSEPSIKGRNDVAIAWRAFKAFLHCLALLIGAGADVDKADPDGCTAAMYAAQYGRDDCLSLLIESGADLARVDKAAQSTMDLATDPECQSIIRNTLLVRADKAAIIEVVGPSPSEAAVESRPRARSL